MHFTQRFSLLQLPISASASADQLARASESERERETGRYITHDQTTDSCCLTSILPLCPFSFIITTSHTDRQLAAEHIHMNHNLAMHSRGGLIEIIWLCKVFALARLLHHCTFGFVPCRLSGHHCSTLVRSNAPPTLPQLIPLDVQFLLASVLAIRWLLFRSRNSLPDPTLHKNAPLCAFC